VAASDLGTREQRLVAITCTAFAVTPEPIVEQVHAALKEGDLTIEEMLEVVLHFAVYCGWPKASNLEMYVRQSWARVQEDRGVEPEPLPALPNSVAELGPDDWDERIARGAEEFAEVNLIGAPPPDSPYQHAGILNFVFGHVWQRPRLGRRERRFVTVACVGVCEAPIPIWSHVGSALRSGDITKPEMDALIAHFREHDTDRRADVLQTEADAAWHEMQARPT
jgi:4-carboxymuconolactone decarboxylase